MDHGAYVNLDILRKKYWDSKLEVQRIIREIRDTNPEDRMHLADLCLELKVKATAENEAYTRYQEQISSIAKVEPLLGLLFFFANKTTYIIGG